MYFRVLLFWVIGALPVCATWAAPAQQAFTDWQVTCNNQNFCVARNTGQHFGLVMTLSRSAGAHTDASLRIELGGLEPHSTKPSPVASRFLLDGQPLKLTSPRWRSEPLRVMTSDGATVSAFLAHIQDADAITLTAGPQIISLKGLKAALLFIDDRQQRVGSQTAWISKGNNPPLRVPPAPPLKEVVAVNPTPTPLSQTEREDLLDYGNWKVSNIQCSLDPGRREVRIWALTDTKALMAISCEAGAYNTVDLAWLVSRRKPFSSHQVRLRLPFTPGSGDSNMELMNAGFDEKNHELTTLAKGRGLADCGIQTRWRFDGQRFSLVRYAEEPSCDNWQGPDAWPTLWITR